MKETIFVKYNRTRKEEFQIRTSIIEEEGKRWVEKTALTAAASSHIQSLKEKKEQLKQCYQNIEAADGQCRWPDGQISVYQRGNSGGNSGKTD